MYDLQEIAGNRATLVITPYRNVREDAVICRWYGTAPFCGVNECPPGTWHLINDQCGDGPCCLTGYKIYCCS